jgi:hypothetical protein
MQHEPWFLARVRAVTERSPEELEEFLRERASNRNCELVVEETESGWVAAFMRFDASTDAQGVTIMGGDQAADRNTALVELLRLDEIDRA